MDITTTRKALKLGYQYHLHTSSQHYLYCRYIRLLNETEIFITSSPSPNQCLPIPPYVTYDQLALLCALEAPGSSNKWNWRSFLLIWQESFSVLNKGSLYQPGFPAVLLLTPEHTLRPSGGFPTSSNLFHHRLLNLQGLEWEGKDRMECQSRGLPFPYSILPALVTHFWLAVDPIRGP